jgi:prepilin-type N-terminal cleavage/methylation domain-containing protein
MTLIEMIAVLAIIAIFAAAVVPLLFRQMDRAAGSQEAARLKSCSTALQESIMRNRYIPGTNDWSTVIANEAGVSLSSVTTNSRNRNRYFLADPNLRIGSSATLPYVQEVGGVTGVTNARVMLLSSIGPPLTAAPAGADFDGIWNWVDDSPLPPTNSVFANIKRGDDIKVQRIDLGSLFVQLALTTNSSTLSAYYSISTNAVSTAQSIVPAAGFTNRFLISSVLGLYLSNGVATDSQQILTRNSSFAYEGDVWLNTIYGRPPSSSGSGFSTLGIGAMAYAIVTNFLAAPKNYGTGASNQIDVVQSMIDYMNAYDAWAGSNFTNSTLKNAAIAKQGVMTRAVNGLCCSPIPPEHLAP